MAPGDKNCLADPVAWEWNMSVVILWDGRWTLGADQMNHCIIPETLLCAFILSFMSISWFYSKWSSFRSNQNVNFCRHCTYIGVRHGFVIFAAMCICYFLFHWVLFRFVIAHNLSKLFVTIWYSQIHNPTYVSNDEDWKDMWLPSSVLLILDTFWKYPPFFFQENLLCFD